MRGRLIPSWGQSGNQPPAYSADTRADSIPLPANSIHTGRAALESLDLPQPFRDIGLVLLGSFTTVSAVVVFAILLFIKL